MVGYSYVGENLEVRIQLFDDEREKKTPLLVYLHPNEIVQEGDELGFTISANFVSVVKEC